MTTFFQYYIPGLRTGSGTTKRAREIIGASVQGCVLKERNIGEGPGRQGAGLLIAAVPEHRMDEFPGAEIERAMGYIADPARQKWIDGGDHWVGYNVDSRPTADHLRRNKVIPGYQYECPVSGKWTVPLARKIDGTTLFDQQISFLPDRTIQKRPVDRYNHLCEFAAEHYAFLTGIEADDDGITVLADERYATVAVEALGVNYHVGPFELSLLGTLTVQSAVLICGLLCDWPGLCDLMKARDDLAAKKNSDPESSTMSYGEVGE